ncbi:UDP-N-acetylmuramate--L-alanine ligase [bacterium]|nr:UDP-N-acetylmuramate--L-alanine ligase [bacterium]
MSKIGDRRPILGRTRRVHFTGIGGIGMSGIAEVLINLGFTVTGSDRALSPITEHLRSLGADIREGHSGDAVRDADVVVISSAVRPDNPEVTAAHDLKIPVIRRAEMLGELMRMKQGIAVGGTHGKTTTTSMIGLVLQEGGFDPTLIVGGRLKSLKTNARLGEGDYLVVEADEFDRSFLSLTPTVAVVTNIESEHLDCYKDLDEIKRTFVSFVNKVPFYGAAVLCLDEPAIQEILPRIERRIIPYGLTPQADCRAADPAFRETQSEFTAVWRGESLGRIRMQLPGLHNVKNALAAVATGIELDIPFGAIRRGLEEFTGVHRRFEIKSTAGDVIVVDDYAHHPTEIKATLRAARTGWNRRVIAVFQPHLYSRTRDFHQEFGQSFFDADVLIVTDVYGSREEPIPGVSGALVADAAKAFGHRRVLTVRDPAAAAEAVLGIVRPGDLVVTLGAGDIHKAGEAVTAGLGGKK